MSSRGDRPTNPTNVKPGGSPGFGEQESGASGGPPPTSEELAGRRAGESAGDSVRDNADQHEVQGSADNDADHESGDRREGAPKRMD
jgi:hypothetical protein